MPTTVWGVKDLHTSAQLVLAKRLGFFQQHGLEVECKLFSAEDKFLDAFERSPAKPLAWTQTLPQLPRVLYQALAGGKAQDLSDAARQLAARQRRQEILLWLAIALGAGACVLEGLRYL